jgi:hypothetical protein
MRTEDEMRAVAHISRKTLKGLVNSFGYGLDILRIGGVLECIRRGPLRQLSRLLQFVPVDQRRPGRRLGVLRIQGQQHHLGNAVADHLSNSVLTQGMPVPHRHVRPEFHAVVGTPTIVERLRQRTRLLAREPIDRRAPSDDLVILPDLLRTHPRNEPAEEMPKAPTDGNVDDRRVHEEVIQKRSDILRLVRPSQVHQNHTYAIAGLERKRFVAEVVTGNEPVVISIPLKKLAWRHNLSENKRLRDGTEDIEVNPCSLPSS